MSRTSGLHQIERSREADMTREYAFAKKVTEEQAEQILKEGNELEKAQKVEIVNDGMALDITVEETDDFQVVMERLVNIVARLTGGNTFSFTRHIYHD
jgi:hypothetical protein